MSTQLSAERTHVYGALLVFLGSVLFSTKAVIVKLAYQYEVDSISLLALRMLFALPVFVLVGAWHFQRRPEVRPILRRQWWKVIVLGACGYYLASLLDFWGLQYITASLERVVLFIYPTLVLLISAVFLRKKVEKRQLWALLITYLGISIAFWDSLSDAQQLNIWRGGALVFGAACSYAFYVVGSGELLPRLGTKIYNSLAMSAAAIAILVHHYWTNGWQLWGFPPQVYQYALLIAFFATVLPSFLIAEGIRLIGANNSGLIGSIGPISTIVMAYLFLGERLSIWQWVGTLLVIFGVLLIVLLKNTPVSEK
ncbi:MAG: DMT family transporter [Bacteroidota bacterium]